MLKANVLANAAAIVALIIYFICVILTATAPELLFNFTALTTHGLNLEPLRVVTPQLDLGNVIVGAILTGASTWLTLYAVAYFYNKLQK